MSQLPIEQKYNALIIECDSMIKSGKIDHVIKLLNELVISQVPRSARQGLAKCCRRVGLISTGLRLLHPIIRSPQILSKPVENGEIAEYAVLLSRNGSIDEALELLSGVDPTKSPEALLYLGQCYIQKWQYIQAVTYFEKFLNSAADDYSKLIARVNLISGYIVLFRFNEAVQVLVETVEKAQEAKATRLLANCFELWGQVHFWQNDFTQARRMLSQAAEIFNNTQSSDQLLILKTESIMQALESKSEFPLLAFREQALERKNWESVREADLFRLKVTSDPSRLDHLVFGTPHEPYRERIEKLAGAKSNLKYIFGQTKGPQLNLQTGEVSGSENLPVGKKTHQLLATLTRDFYAPVNMGTLFHALYPNEYFNIDSSPFRVRQAILRSRQWLEAHAFPVSIIQKNGSYSLHFDGECGIHLELNPNTVTPLQTRWNQLKSSFSEGYSFSADEACQKCQWSRTTFRRIADWAYENSFLQKSGTGKSTIYQILDPGLSTSWRKKTAA